MAVSIFEGVQGSNTKHFSAAKYVCYDDLTATSLLLFRAHKVRRCLYDKVAVLSPSTTKFGQQSISDLTWGPPLSMARDERPPPLPITESNADVPLEWDWDVEHEDRGRERKADAALPHITPFQVDRSLLKDVVREKFAVPVVRIKFLSSGTFHKAYLVTLSNGKEVVGRVARRFMPRAKTESEVATLQYLREKTTVPVPTVYHHDSNPYNRLGGEYILMSKAPGRPLAEVYHSLSYDDLVKVLTNLAKLVIPLFGHRFSHLGSIYAGPNPLSSSTVTTPSLSSIPTPKGAHAHSSAYPFSPTLAMSLLSLTSTSTPHTDNYHIGPIISWPFFGSNRGDLTHPNEINRGPWKTTQEYFQSCMEREVAAVIRENEGKAAPHRLHLDPDEIRSSRHHHLKAVPGDESDDSDEWDLDESETEWDGPGDGMYRDYRRMQRSTFLVAHLEQRIACVKAEMERWRTLMDKMMEKAKKEDEENEEEVFGIDCHDLSLENIFVGMDDPTTITCIIDWESTTTRPLWACAHLPAFLQSSPFTAKLFREIIVQMAEDPKSSVQPSFKELAKEWLHYEEAGTRLRMAHRFIEWDGWEEGLVESILGPEEDEDDWLKDTSEDYDSGYGRSNCDSE